MGAGNRLDLEVRFPATSVMGNSYCKTSLWMNATATAYSCRAYTDFSRAVLRLSPSTNGQPKVDLARWPREEYQVQTPRATQEKKLDKRHVRWRELWKSPSFCRVVVEFLPQAGTDLPRSECNTCCQNLTGSSVGSEGWMTCYMALMVSLTCLPSEIKPVLVFIVDLFRTWQWYKTNIKQSY